MCNIEFLEVEDIEETYVKELIKLKKRDDQVRNNLLFGKKICILTTPIFCI